MKNAEFTRENGEQWRFTHEIYSREFTNRFNGQVTWGQRIYDPLVMSNVAIEAMAIEIVDFPIRNGDFP